MALGDSRRLTDLDLPQQDPFSTQPVRVGRPKTGHPAPTGGVERFLITGRPMLPGTCSQLVPPQPAHCQHLLDCYSLVCVVRHQ